MLVSRLYPETTDNAILRNELPAVSPPQSPFPQELQSRKQWVIFSATKVPHNARTGVEARSNDPATWSTFTEAMAAFRSGRGAGVGFMFSPDDPYFGIDLDKCRDPETGIIEPWAQAIIDRFRPYAYIEISFSGTGAHLIGRGTLPPGGNRKGPIETYDRGRYFTMSGNVLSGHADLADCQTILDRWHAETFPAKAPPSPRPQPTVEHNLEDDALIEKARSARNGGKFTSLMAGDISACGSHSEAELALVSMLAFWTQDPDQLDRLIRSSGLYRPKWERTDYRERTIKFALESVSATYDPKYSSGAWHAPAATTATHSTTNNDVDQIPEVELRAALREIHAALLHERELRQAAEDRAKRNAEVTSKTISILRNPDLPLGERATLVALILELRSRIANGRQPTENGYLMPAIAIAEATGQAENTVGRQLRSLNKKGLIDKRVVREAVKWEAIDGETGEIADIHGTRDRNYIDIGGNALDNVIDLADRAAAYRRGADDRQHGGTRKAACIDHPDAGTVKHWHLECAECHTILEHGSSFIAPEETAGSSGIKMTPEDSVFNQSYSGIKLIPELSPFHPAIAPPIIPTSTIKMAPDPTMPLPPFGYLPGMGEVAGNDRYTS